MKHLNTIIFVIVAALTLLNCDFENDNSSLTQQEELNELIAHKSYIKSLITNTSCSENSQCGFVGLGHKPCGGHWEYLVYSSNNDTKLLLEQVAIYNLKEEAYNRKWNVVSDCAYVMPPIRVDCINNKCVAVYSN